MSRPHLRYKNQTDRERTWTIHFIALEKAIKGTVLIVVAFKLLTLFDRDVHGWAEEFVTRHGIDLTNRYAHAVLKKLVGFGNTQVVETSIVALVYASLLFIEGIGLWLQKRWAEYLTAGLTAMSIPVEIYEIYERFTWVRIAILVLNIFVIWYLTTRLRDEKREVNVPSGPDPERPQIKICGITNLEDAQLVADLGADQVGFNFYEKSPRYISPDKARSIAEQIPESLFKVGVFVNESIEMICEIAEAAKLDAIQLHGDEDADFVAKLRVKKQIMIIKAVRVSPEFNQKSVLVFGADAILLDSYSVKERGGTGETFDWNTAKAVRTVFPDIYLAGGLSSENVTTAIRSVKPYAVDACSKLESSPGKKDPAKVAAFINAVKEAI